MPSLIAGGMKGEHPVADSVRKTMEQAEPNSSPNQSVTGGGEVTRDAFKNLRIIFGGIWLVNTWFQANGAYIGYLFLKSFNAGIQGQPEWLARYTQAVINGIQVLGPSRVAVATLVIDALLAFSLITGFRLRLFAWVGIVYNLFMWSTVGGMGGPYTQGATDPGTAIVYALAFVFVLIGLSPRTAGAGFSSPLVRVGRLLFGLLWAFDAFWKWQPYFLRHSIDYLVQAQQGQAAWVVAYIHFFVVIAHAVGPIVFGVFAAVVETLIALSLLFNRGLNLMLPIGALYSFGLWTTAEGWGGPYGRGFTGNRGDILGTAIIYCLIFLYLMVIYYAPFRARKMKVPK